MGPVTRCSSPVRGLIKAIREALGMTTAQLAKRLDVKQPSVVAIEQSEAKGTIELATLRRVAEALDCTLVYALVPNKPLEAAVRDGARVCATAPGAGRAFDAAGGPEGNREGRRSAAR
jgi:predicted DNA-binding mobile mystery protein A